MIGYVGAGAPSCAARLSVVIPVWNQWAMTRACLQSLAPTLADGDEVIVVDNGSTDATPTGLAQFPWVTVVRNATNRGFAAACNQGVMAASGAIVVFLNNDTLLPECWLEGLLAPFADASVVATGPRSNCVSGPQLVASVDYDVDALPSLHAFARTWRRAHRGQTSESARLVGFCLAVRARALRAIGGWDEGFAIGGAEDDDLCLRLAAAGGRLLICHDTFVHHHGHATFDGNGLDWFAIQQTNVRRLVAKHNGQLPARRRSAGPLLSACMIVRDEQAVLPHCLRALHGLVDEVIVYDTGSTDGSQTLALAAGATFVEGEWDDDFGRARNAALAHCAGEWILHVDADEVFEGDPSAIRAALEQAPVDAFALEILNLGGDGKHDVAHRPCRLFRRDVFHWRGRLHEQVVRRDGGTDYALGVMGGGRLVHSGYTPERMRSKAKAERNLRLAALDAGRDGDVHPAERLVNLARSYMLAERNEEALALFAQARGLDGTPPILERLLGRSAAQACLDLGRPAAALAWLDDLERTSGSSPLVRCLRGNAYVELQRWGEALAAYDGLVEARDDDGMVLPAFILHRNRARCHFMLEQWAPAVDAAARVATAATCDEPIWHILAESCERTGRDIIPLLDAVPDARLSAVFAQLVHLAPALAHPLLERLVERARYRTHALALAIRLAPAMPLEQGVRWSARLRALGLAAHCPLVRRASDESQPVGERILSAAAAQSVFGDAQAAAAVAGAMHDV